MTRIIYFYATHMYLLCIYEKTRNPSKLDLTTSCLISRPSCLESCQGWYVKKNLSAVIRNPLGLTDSADCSGFLVTQSATVTAGHCVCEDNVNYGVSRSCFSTSLLSNRPTDENCKLGISLLLLIGLPTN